MAPRGSPAAREDVQAKRAKAKRKRQKRIREMREEENR
jgi:hypothetical protein